MQMGNRLEIDLKPVAHPGPSKVSQTTADLQICECELKCLLL